MRPGPSTTSATGADSDFERILYALEGHPPQEEGVPDWAWRRRDLALDELWDLSRARSQARREAVANRPNLLKARRAGVGLVIAAVAAAAPAKTPAGPRSSPAGGSALERDQLLRFGSRGEAVAEMQRALGIPADGIFGPQTRKAVRAFQARQGLVADGIVGPRTRAALEARESVGAGMFRAPWVASVQRALGIPADGIFGPQTRGAVRAFQARHGLVVDGIVGPQTLAALGLSGNAPPEAAPDPQAVPVSSSVSVGAQAVVAEARRQLGKPYMWGGSGPGSFDCSGLTAWAFRAAGVTLPHQSQAQFGLGRAVSRANVRAGDLVFFATNGPGASHVGIAVDGGSFISATSQGVRVQPIGGSYWGAAYVGARRVI